MTLFYDWHEARDWIGLGIAAAAMLAHWIARPITLGQRSRDVRAAYTRRRSRRSVRSDAHNQKRVATRESISAAEGGSFSGLTREELGEVWVATLRSAGARDLEANGRVSWVRVVRDPEVVVVCNEFRRRMIELAAEREAYLQTCLDAYAESWPCDPDSV